MEKLQLIKELQKAWIRFSESKNLVDDGKEVLCSNKLQGALTVLADVIEQLAKEIKEERKNELV